MNEALTPSPAPSNALAVVEPHREVSSAKLREVFRAVPLPE
jgi:hypothetical protein